MNTRGFFSQEPSSSEAENETFRILAIYDSTESSREAARASAVILRELDDEILVHKSSWESEALLDESIRERAAEAAAQADVIVIAVGDLEPSPVLRQWINDWQQKRQLPAGLLALIPCNESKTSGGLAEFLYETAVSTHMDFLCRKPRRF